MKNNVIKKRRSFISFVLSVLIVMMSVSAVFPISAVSDDPSAAPASNEPVEFTLEQLQMLQVPDSDIPSLMTRAQIEEKGHAVRLKAEEPNKNTVVFQNRDGSKTAYFYNTPVKYTDESGNERDKSSTITAYSGMYAGKSYAYAMTDNDVKVYFSRIGTEGVKLSSGGYDIEMVPINTGSLLIPSVSFENDDTIRYNNMYGLGTAIEYKTLLNGVKEDIVLSKYTGQNSFSFMLYTDGLALVENGGDFYLADKMGARVASIGKVIANDSGNKTVYGTMNYNTVKAGAQYMINISVDAAFLTASDTVYPVRIDPTVTIDQGDSGNILHNRIEDTGLYESNAYVSGLPSNIYPVGYYASGTGVGRMAIRFPMFVDPWSDDMASYYQYLADIKGYQITSATLSLYAESVEGSTTVSVYPMTSAPSYSYTGRECNTTIFNAYSSGYGSSASVNSTGRKYFDVTSIVKLWADYSFGNSDGAISSGILNPINGLMIKNNDENNAMKIVSFYSSMYYDPNYQPNLSVTYNSGNAYYINNIGNGKFIGISGTSIQSGTYSESDSYKWFMDPVGTDTYVLRSCYGNHDKVLYSNNGVLAVASVSSSASSSSLSSYYKWVFEENYYGYTIKNSANTDKVLGVSGSSFVLADITSYSSLISYSWRYIDVEDYVNLNSFSIADVTIDEGEVKDNAFTIVKSPYSAIWCNFDDFTYVINETYATISPSQGRIIGLKSGNHYVEVIHKITGISTTFKLNVCKKITFLTINDTLSAPLNILQDGFDEHYDLLPVNVNTYYGEYSQSQFISYMQSCNIFVTMAHGDNYGDDTGINLDDRTNKTTEEILYGEELEDVDLSNLDIAIFLSCHAGENDSNLIKSVNERGATIAIGFTGSILIAEANLWLDSFFNALFSNLTVEQALETASERLYSDGVTCVYFGDASISFLN